MGQGGASPLQEAVLCLSPGPGAAWIQWGLRLRQGLGLGLRLLLGLQGAVTGDGRGGVDFIQGGARRRKQVSGGPGRGTLR